MVNIFLDFDGTLADSSEGIYIAFANACDHVGINAPPLIEFRSCIGPPIQVLAQRLFPKLEADRLETLRLKFRIDYDRKYYRRVEWYEGVIEGLQKLHAEETTRLSVVTNKPTLPTKKLIANAGLSGLFECVIGVDYRVVHRNGPVFRSKYDSICHALSLTECPARCSIYVGDTLSDQRACQESGVAFIAATYGFHSWQPQELEGTTTACNFREVVSLLRSRVMHQRFFPRSNHSLQP